MNSTDYETKRQRMVREQLQSRGITSPGILAVMGALPRHDFVCSALKAHAYEDRPLSIGSNQTISQPYMVAVMSQILDAGPGARVLEIGTGCGYQTAVLAALGATVFSIEIRRELSEQAAERLTSLQLQAHLRVGNGYLGWPDQAPFSHILVACAAPETPWTLLDQLEVGGVLLIPVGPVNEGQELRLYQKGEDGEITYETLMGVRFVPFVESLEPPLAVIVAALAPKGVFVGDQLSPQVISVDAVLGEHEALQAIHGVV
ncbi:MAG: protein-L-isoaspartate(D-aspartate) O-methyltransferase [Planctomycetota bacterium]|nr:protein-L-isoaspartate(D-aspartate) O-methyltransferase [Planctomycetota bacterium]